MRKETKKILQIIEDDYGHSCGRCKACLRIERRLDNLVKRLLEAKNN